MKMNEILRKVPKLGEQKKNSQINYKVGQKVQVFTSHQRTPKAKMIQNLIHAFEIRSMNKSTKLTFYHAWPL